MPDAGILAVIGGAALVAGAVNAIAGGGSLISFPVLVACGLAPVTASLTNTVAMCPGYLGATYAQRKDLAGQSRRAWLVLPIGALGGVAGALLLLHTGARAFDRVVPILILFASLLVGFQDQIRRRLFGHQGRQRAEALAMLPVAAAAVYGGYFGAGMGVIVVAALGIVLDDSLVRINALKQSVSLAVNIAAAGIFVVSGRVDWPVAAVMLGASLVGGLAGGALASRIPARALRYLIVTIGLAVAGYYFTRW